MAVAERGAGHPRAVEDDGHQQGRAGYRGGAAGVDGAEHGKKQDTSAARAVSAEPSSKPGDRLLLNDYS